MVIVGCDDRRDPQPTALVVFDEPEYTGNIMEGAFSICRTLRLENALQVTVPIIKAVKID
jgi:hypothetical protein